MKKRIIAMLLAVLSIVGVFVNAPTASAATSPALVTKIQSLLPIITYAMPSSGASRVYAYSDASLSTKQSSYYVDSFSEQIVVTAISDNGQAVKIRYLSGKGAARDKWFRTDDIFGLAGVSIADFQANAAMTVYRMSAVSSVTKYGSISKGTDVCYKLGNHNVGGTAYNTVIYKLSSASTVNGITAKHKMGLVAQNTYNSSVKPISDEPIDLWEIINFCPIWPCEKSTNISTMYRYWNGGNPGSHKVRTNIYNAFDVSGSSGDKIFAVEKGTVVDKGYQGSGFGYYVILEHSNGLRTLYGHLKQAASVNVGDTVNQKQVIGYMGSTGNSSGNHLHFEMFNPNDKNAVINPWATYYQGKVSLTVGGNSYKANSKYPSDAAATAWCNWLKNNCTKNSAGDYVFKK